MNALLLHTFAVWDKALKLIVVGLLDEIASLRSQ